MKKSLFAVVLVSLFAVAAPAQAQSVDVLYGFGKAFDIPSASFMTFHVPEIEARTKGFTFNARMWFDAFSGDKSQSDLSAKYEFKIKPWSDRLTYSMSLVHQSYFMDFTDTSKQRRTDWTYFVQGRYNLRK